MTTCDTNLIFESVTSSFIFILILFLFILSLLSATVPSSLFRRDGLSTYKVVILIILPCPLLALSQFTLRVSEETQLQSRVLFWFEFCWTTLLPLLLLLVLFVPVVSILHVA